MRCIEEAKKSNWYLGSFKDFKDLQNGEDEKVFVYVFVSKIKKECEEFKSKNNLTKLEIVKGEKIHDNFCVTEK